jgi:hypothetical protein
MDGIDLSAFGDMSGPAPDIPDPSQIPHELRLAAVDRALALPVRTPEAVAEAVGADMLKHCPTVCAMLSNPNADIVQLRKFLAIGHSVQQGTVSNVKASERVGYDLFGQYVKPKTG